MKNSNLWKIFRKFSKNDVQNLGKILNYPLFNKKTEVIELYKYLSKAKISPKVPMNKEAVFSAIFPGKKFDAPKLRYTMSFLLKNIKQYLIQKQIDKNTTFSQLLLCQSILDLEAGDVFLKEWKNAYQSIDEKITRGGLSHLYKSQLHEMHFDYTRKHARQGDMHLQEISDELTLFYLIQTLRQRCLMLSHQNVAVQEYEQVFFEEVLSFLRQSNMKKNHLIEIYYHSYYAAIEPEEISHFEKLKNLVEKHWKKISPREIRDIYVLIINYCIKKINVGEKKFIDEAFNFYKVGLERNLLLEKGILSRFTYKNISTIGLIAQQDVWVLQFLETYKKHLHPNERNITYQYNLAIYYFRLSRYEEALQLLRNVEFKNDVFYNLDIRRMLIRIYYELGHFSSLGSLLESFTIYINRHKNLGYHKDNYLNLIKVVKKIIRSNINNEKTRLNIIQKIENTKALAERKWIMKVLST